MIDRKLILTDKQYVKDQLLKKDYDIEYIDAIAKLLRAINRQTEALNELSQKRNCQNRDNSVTLADKRKLRAYISNAQKDLNALEKYTLSLLYDVPNIPDPLSPVGHTEADNIIISESHDHYKCKVINPLPHWEIGEKLGIFHSEASSKISGSGFSVVSSKGAKLMRALINYGLSLHEDNYKEFLTPHMVTSETLTTTGHLPKFAIEQYKSDKDDLWLIPTAEVPLTAIYKDRTFDYAQLPIKVMSYSIAFRRESGSAGRETRGLQRVHEFHKVELLKIVEPESITEELMDLVDDCLKIIKDLKLRYRLVELCTGEMGDKYARCFDIEVYSPAVAKWLEVASIGHFSDYQSRRANIKYKDKHGKNRLVYTLNGSGIAAARVWLSIIETYQQPDGTIKVPDVLVPFMGCEYIS